MYLNILINTCLSLCILFMALKTKNGNYVTLQEDKSSSFNMKMVFKSFWLNFIATLKL